MPLSTGHSRMLYFPPEGEMAGSREPWEAGAASRLGDLSDGDRCGLLAAILETSGAGLAVVAGPDLRFWLVNAAYRALTPSPESDPTGRRFDEVWPSDDAALPALRRARDEGEPFHSDGYAVAAQGGVRHFSLHVKPIPFRGAAALLVALRETTSLREARKKAEQALQRASEMDAIVNGLPDAFVLVGPRGEILRMNDAAARVIHATPEERELPLVARWSRYRAFTPEGWPMLPEHSPVARALAGQTVRGFHLRLEDAGTSNWILASAAPIRAPDGTIAGAVLTFSDETPLHALEEAREDLVRMISHDLRTPLNAVLAQAHMLQHDGGDPAKARERGQTIARSCHRMAGMIQDLLDATLLEAGQLRMDRRPLDLSRVVREMIERQRGALDVDRVRISVGSPPPGPVHADPERLERIVVNLVSNALKYSPPESQVAVEIAPAEGGGTITVADRGVGISPEDFPHLFERFFRARGTRRPEGIGLGLYISRLLVEAHGGRIDVQTQLGQGTTLRVFLPSDRLSPARPAAG